MLVQSVIVIGLVWLTTFTCASPGDESTKYQLCLRKCIIEASGEEFDSASEEAVAVLVANPDCFFKKFEPSFLKSRYLDILWDTEAHCRYFCMHRTEKDELDFAATRGLARPRPQKYYGKWPFLRLFGMQEFFSVIFSLCNLVVNIYGHMFIFLPVVSSHYPYQGILLVFFLFQCLAWIFSAIFHARDTRLTERFDYFFAMLITLVTLYVSSVRVFGISSSSGQVKLFSFLLFYFAYYIYRMNYVLFDYGYHVSVSIKIGAFTGVLWLLWFIYRDFLLNDPASFGRWNILYFLVGSSLAGILVSWDLPPYWKVLDSHSLWHASTAPLLYFWYKFFAEDSLVGMTV